jgi:hypothetical protein
LVIRHSRCFPPETTSRSLNLALHPKHRTLCDFRALHLKEFAALFVQVVQLASECGLVKLGTIAVDGTKLRANASRHKAMSYERMQAAEIELKAQIDALLARAAQADVAEANEPELDIPAEIARREQRVQAIQAAKQRIEARQREADAQCGRKPDDGAPPGQSEASSGEPKKSGPAFKRAFGQPAPKAQDNFTDPDSRIMKTSVGFEQCFNAQTAVDSHRQIVVAAELTHCAADSAELPGMLDAVARNTGHHPEVALADAGYRSEAVLAQLSASPTEVIVALGREGKKQTTLNADKLPHTAAMAASIRSPPSCTAIREPSRNRSAAQTPRGTQSNFSKGTVNDRYRVWVPVVTLTAWALCICAGARFYKFVKGGPFEKRICGTGFIQTVCFGEFEGNTLARRLFVMVPRMKVI